MARRRVALLLLISTWSALVAPVPSAFAGTASLGDWPDIDDALIRPGVGVTGLVECTANFVFKTRDNASLLVGTTSSCMDGLALGDKVDIAGAAVGTLRYSSRVTMDAVGETDAAVLGANDFALIEVPADARSLVHPAMLHYGGPTGLLRSHARTLDPVVHAYGASTLSPAGFHDGAVVSRTVWTSTVYLAAPALPGDGGAGVILDDGRALGAVSTLNLAPFTGSATVTNLDAALRYARLNAGLDVELATWHLL